MPSSNCCFLTCIGFSRCRSGGLVFPSLSEFPTVYCQTLSISIGEGQARSGQVSRSVVSNCLQSHELQHARPPCPSPTPRVHSNSRSSSQWCHPAISSSVIPFSSCPQKTSISALLTMPKPLTVWITINWKILKKMGIPGHLTCLLRNLYAGQEEQLELDMDQQTGSK